MKSIMISSNCSGGGKTTVTLGIMKALKNRGFRVQGYKVGPDYIDTDFHSRITGQSSRNLDLFLMGEAGVKASFSRGQGDLGVIEGVMGLYDGKGIDWANSTYHVSEILNVPIILVLSPGAQVATLCAEINGIVDFQNANVVGVILNNITEGFYKLLKASIEKNCKVKVLGYLPKDERMSLESRHLGLVQSSEIENLDEKIQVCAELLEKHVDMDLLINEFKETLKYEDNFHLEPKGIKIAVAYDKAFSFYYKENLEILQEAGEVVYFSPLKDMEIPKNIDFLYLGGGYPELFPSELAQNKSMIESIKNALEDGLPCYAECGGLMYLTSGELKENETEIQNNFVGFFDGTYTCAKDLQNFGYATIELDKENKILPKGTKINCHEFHKSFVRIKDDKVYNLSKIAYDGTINQWECGYIKNNTLAAYGHVHFFGNLEWVNFLLNL